MKSGKTNNSLTIQGILKEAHYLESPFFFHDKSGKIPLKLVDIVENKIRDDSDNKRVCFRSLGNVFALCPGVNYELSSQFHRCTVTGKFEFECKRDNIFFFKIPESLFLSNLRQSDRSNILPEFQKPISVFLITASNHAEGELVVEDVSSEGYGGRLRVPSGFPIDSETSIAGKLEKSGEIAIINGLIKNAKIVPSSDVDYDLYKIGIKQLTQIARGSNSSFNTRTQTRYRSNVQFYLGSMLFPDQVLGLNVDDISINGFSGTSTPGSTISGVPIGTIFLVKNENFKAKLVHFDQDRFHFLIQKRSVIAGINWLKKMTPLIDSAARCTTKDAKELYRIFLQAGAVSTQYLKRHQLHQALLVRNSSENNESSFLHRWFIGGNQTEADAYISAIRTGNTSWVLGDIAKKSDSPKKINDAVRSFFHSFADFASREASIGSLGIVWVKDHPYWQKWYEVLKAKHRNLICSEVKMNYFRVVDSSKNPEQISIKLIEKENFEIREAILMALDSNMKTYLENSFDFVQNGCGSYVLEENSGCLKRLFFKIDAKSGEYLAIVCVGANGISVNRYLDSLFLVPLTNKTVEGESLENDVQNIASGISRKEKIIIPSVRILSSETLVKQGTEMTSLILYPRGFKFF